MVKVAGVSGAVRCAEIRAQKERWRSKRCFERTGGGLVRQAIDERRQSLGSRQSAAILEVELLSE
jgi:hypothetical protein